MVATCAAASSSPDPGLDRQLLPRAEGAFRAALTASLDDLPVADQNLLHFHYRRGLPTAQLAELFCASPSAIVRQLDRVRERLLRDVRRHLAARTQLARPQLDQLLELARQRLDPALRSVLR
jgi:DNA-directed RNA polymerase specialized sigma24 family protein